MIRSSIFRRPWAGPLAVAALTLLLAPLQGRGDDRDLLRFNTANPYLFILLDTSASMNLATGAGDLSVPGFGDDPGSRIFQAKSALYQVFQGSEDLNFGFATFNQDQARVVSKHWLYYLDQAVAGGWPLDWPTPDPDGLTQWVDTLTVDTDGDGLPDAGDGIPDTVVNDVEGDTLVIGRHFDLAPVGIAGTCNSPLDLADAFERQQVDAFAKLDTDGLGTTEHWVTWGGKVYRLTVAPDASGADTPGAATLDLDLTLERVSRCNTDFNANFDDSWTAEVTLLQDPELNEFLMVDGAPQFVAPLAPGKGGGGGGGGGNGTETVPGLWAWQDALNSADCGAGSPFTGKGWEGNYDSGVVTGDAAFDANVTTVDRLCADPLDPATCIELKPMQETQLSAFGRQLDRGDMLPFDWLNPNREDLLRRLAPNHPGPVPDFRASAYFADLPNGDGYLDLADPDVKPIVAMGQTPLGKAILDTRCWYMGTEGSQGNKCSSAAFSAAGWDDVACTYDSEFGCRRPYIIVISDGLDTCAGENPAADTAAMFSSSGVRTWALNLGDPKNCTSSGGGSSLWSITRNSGGECIDVTSKEDLLLTLEEILGEILEEARSFASAAVPNVQATADQVIYVSSFTPLNNKPVWNGHVDAFLKPLPVDEQGRPDRTDVNHVWDAADVIVSDQYTEADPLGNGLSQRRVYYSTASASGAWPTARRFLDPTNAGLSDAVRYDLWRGFGLVQPTRADGTLTVLEEAVLDLRTVTILGKTFSLKTATLADSGETVEYLLGDIFHASPVAVGTPIDFRYFAADEGSGQENECVADDSGANANRGYRCFLERQRRRRKVLVVGANDGFLHGLNAGRYDSAEQRYDNGSGHELWAYAPREELVDIRERTFDGATHQFGVDASVTAADVFIDPLHGGTPTPEDRLWRTVVVGGQREGGSSYFALDITQPDPVTKQADGTFEPGGAAEIASCASGGAGCGPVPYPSALWEFRDDTDSSDVVGAKPWPAVLLDEDGNGQADLGETWSPAVIGRILVCTGVNCSEADAPSDLEDRFVAVFGGGMDPTSKDSLPDAGWAYSGNFVYMVDIETGEILYKRAVEGAVPAQLAAVDTDQDTYLDRIYLGTTLGFVYRIDLVADAGGNLPAPVTVAVTDVEGGVHLVRRLAEDSAGDPVWLPRRIFDANFDGLTPTTAARPIYQTPSVVLVGNLGRYAISFGTGDREDLWSGTPGLTLDDGSLEPQRGRFFAFVDDSDVFADASLPFTENDFVRVAVADGQLSDDLFLTRAAGQRGWFLDLDPGERVITDSFSLSGVTVFSSFLPDVAITDADGDPVDGGGTCGDKKFDGDTSNRCSKTGTSRVYIVQTTNGNSFMTDLGGFDTRYLEVSTFVTDPYTEPGQNKNIGGDDGGGDEGGGGNADVLSPSEIEVMEALKALFPANCTFANYRIDIKTISADTRIQRIASVPVCLIEKNWKEY